MPKLRMTIEHELPQKRALEIINIIIDGLKNSLEKKFSDSLKDVKGEWIGNIYKFSFSFVDYAIYGVLKVGPKRIEITGNFHFVSQFLKDEIEPFLKN